MKTTTKASKKTLNKNKQKPRAKPKTQRNPPKPQTNQTKPNKQENKKTKQKNLFVLPPQGAVLDLLVSLKHLFNQMFQTNMKKIPHCSEKHDSLGLKISSL